MKTLFSVWFSIWIPFPAKHAIQINKKKKNFSLWLWVFLHFLKSSTDAYRYQGRDQALNSAVRPENEYVLYWGDETTILHAHYGHFHYDISTISLCKHCDCMTSSAQCHTWRMAMSPTTSLMRQTKIYSKRVLFSPFCPNVISSK